jgi:PAS domain S-box-containing protein
MGYRSEDFIDNKTISFNDIILPRYRDYLWDLWLEKTGNKEAVEAEYEIQTSSGEIKWVWEKGCGVYDDEGNLTHLEGFITDITARKNIEKALKESREKLEDAQKMANLGYWYWDVKTGNVDWSDEVYKIFRLDREKFVPQIDSIMKLSEPWPEDFKRAENIMQMAKASDEEGVFEQRFLLPDGSTGYYYSIFAGVYDEENKLIAMRGTVQDITERKHAEEDLRRSEENLRITLNSIGDAVIATDTGGNVTRMNPVAESLTGWMFEDAEGKKLSEIFNVVNAGNREPIDNPVERVLQTGEIICLEQNSVLISRGGKEYRIADSGAPIRDDSGEILGVVLVFHDITTEHILQEQLHHSQKMEAIG